MINSTKEAKYLITYGYIGNGCGNRRWNTLLCTVIQWWANVDFSMACLYHDAERACKLNSEDHRVLSDGYFLLNLNICCKAVKKQKYAKRAYRVAKIFHWAVLLNSETTYKEAKDKLTTID